MVYTRIFPGVSSLRIKFCSSPSSHPTRCVLSCIAGNPIRPAAEIKYFFVQKTLFPELAMAPMIEAVDMDVLPDGPWPPSLSLQPLQCWIGTKPSARTAGKCHFFNVRARSIGEKSSLIYFSVICNRNAAQTYFCGNFLLEIPGCLT